MKRRRLGGGSSCSASTLDERETLEVDDPLVNERSAAGAVDPAAMQLDFYIRSPETDERNNPARRVFDHFFAMEVTWK